MSRPCYTACFDVIFAEHHFRMKCEFLLWFMMRWGDSNCLRVCKQSPIFGMPFQFFVPCSFFTFLCPLLLFLFLFFSFFYFFSSFIFLAPRSFLEFSSAPCSFLSFLVLLAPGLWFVCSLLLYLFYGLLLAPLCQIGLAPCSGITPNRGSKMHEDSACNTHLPLCPLLMARDHLKFQKGTRHVLILATWCHL